MPAIAAHEYSPWDFWSEASIDEREAQLAMQRSLTDGRDGHTLGEQCFISNLASIDNDSLHLGDRTYVAAGAYLTGDLTAGADCGINPYTVIRGRVTMGDGVRIGAHTSILGFNHSMESGTPVFRQPLTSKGIEIGDDVWIGSHVVILDGVKVGSHSVLAASAVVTKDVPDGAVVGGNPARFIRWRVAPDDTGIAPDAAADAAARAEETNPGNPAPQTPSHDAAESSAPAQHTPPDLVRPTSPDLARPASADLAPPTFRDAAPPKTGPAPTDAAEGLAERLAEFAARARDEASALLDRAWRDDVSLFTDRPRATPTVRAQCDAVEIADLLLGTAPPQDSAAAQIARLREWQDAATGAVAPLRPDGRQEVGLGFAHEDVAYHVLSVGYALDLLGSAFEAPLTWVTAATPERVVDFCESLPWGSDAWGAGHHVDGFGTAILWTKRAENAIPAGVEEALFGWLLLNTDPHTGMWGSPTADRGLLPVVNGFYRASRGTFAQFGVPLPLPERVIDTVLRHARDPRWFAPGARDACNVLDIAHPLWLARATGYRGEEVRDLATRLLADTLSTWVPGAGFSFREPSAATRGLAATDPGLQGTEMWLAIIWYLADLAGISDALGYRPRGVHRPEAAAAPR